MGYKVYVLVFYEAETIFPEWLMHLTFPLKMYERTSFSESSPAFGGVTIIYFSCFNKSVVILWS